MRGKKESREGGGAGEKRRGGNVGWGGEEAV